MGWITSTRTLTISPGLMLEGTRILTRPISAILGFLASAPADRHLDFPLGLEQRAVAHLDDRAHLGAFPESQVGAHVGLAHG